MSIIFYGCWNWDYDYFIYFKKCTKLFEYKIKCVFFRDVSFYAITLDSPLSPKAEVTLQIEVSYSHVLEAYPSQITQVQYFYIYKIC